MEELREIRRRLAVIEATGDVTKAMRIISATRLKRIQEYVGKTDEYAQGFREIASRMAPAVGIRREAGADGKTGTKVGDGFAMGNEETCYIVISSDKGLAGGYNINLIEALDQHYRQRARSDPRNLDKAPLVITVGIKGARILRHKGWRIMQDSIDVQETPGIADAEKAARKVYDAYTTGEISEVFLAYTRFVSAGRRIPTIERLLPMSAICDQGAMNGGEDKADEQPRESPAPVMLFEPDPEQLSKEVLPEYLTAILFSAMINARASEFAARVEAMEGANDNAKKLAKQLSFLYNRARQAEITQEIGEIIAGAASLR